MSHVSIQKALSDVYVDRSNPYANFGNSQKLWMGYFCGEMEYRTLLKFDLSTIPDGINIISAKMKLFIDYSPDCHTTAYLTPHIITESWHQKIVTWNNSPSFDVGICGTTEGIKDTGWYQWDVTSIVKAWVNNNYPNNGIMLLCNEKTFFDNRRAISSLDTSRCHSALHPSLTIEFGCMPCSQNVILSGRNFTEKYETVKTSDFFSHTPGFDTSQKSQLTFFVKNQGNHPATIVLEISPNNVDFLVDGKEIEVLPDSLRFAVPYVFAKYTRLSYKSANTGESTLLYIAFQAQV